MGECCELVDTFRKNSGMSSGDCVVAGKREGGVEVSSIGEFE